MMTSQFAGSLLKNQHPGWFFNRLLEMAVVRTARFGTSNILLSLGEIR